MVTKYFVVSCSKRHPVPLEKTQTNAQIRTEGPTGLTDVDWHVPCETAKRNFFCTSVYVPVRAQNRFQLCILNDMGPRLVFAVHHRVNNTHRTCLTDKHIYAPTEEVLRDPHRMVELPNGAETKQEQSLLKQFVFWTVKCCVAPLSSRTRQNEWLIACSFAPTMKFWSLWIKNSRLRLPSRDKVPRTFRFQLNLALNIHLISAG